MDTIKKTVKVAMIKKSLKVGALAKLLDEDSMALSVWFARPDGQSLDKLSQVANALGCDIALVDRNTGEVYK